MENNHQTIGFLLKGIKTEQFATFEKNFKDNSNNMGLSTSVELKLNQKEQQIGVFMDFEFKQKSKPIIKLVVSCHFGIHEDSWNSVRKAETITFPKEFIAHLAMLTVGTSRGILFTKTEGLVFAKYLLPTLDVAKLFQDNIEFPVDELEVR